MKIYSLILFILIASISFAQISKKDEKAINKSLKFYEKKEYDKAIQKLSPALNNNLENKKIWEMELEYQFRKYNRVNEVMQDLAYLLKDENGNPLTITVSFEGSEGTEELVASSARCIRYIENMSTAYIYLRKFAVDPKVDTAVVKAAIDEFNTAEREFTDKNYSKAILFYKKALDIDSNYYRATLYLGDTYYSDENFEEAIKYFSKASSMQPDLLEPKKYLTDAYLKLNMNDEAIETCADGIITFPDSDMFLRLKELAYLKDKKFKRNWIKRPFEVNQMYVTPSEKTEDESPWKYYQEALEMIAPYCDSTGIIVKENDLTDSKYLEVFAWEYMLKNSDDDILEPARKAKKAGYLNEYVFLSAFHIDFWDQFKDYRSNNKQKMIDYLTLYLMKEK